MRCSAKLSSLGEGSVGLTVPSYLTHHHRGVAELAVAVLSQCPAVTAGPLALPLFLALALALRF
jgi:hypothetical protein